MKEAKIRMGVSGLGRIGWPFHCAQIAQHKQFDFVAVQDPEADRREEAKRVYGVQSYERFSDMLAAGALDAVAIATPTHLHRAMTVEALRAGCHVMLEKPMAPNAQDAVVMVREAARRRRILTVYQPRRAEAYFQHLSSLVGSGIIGDVYHVRIGLFQFAIRNDWQALRKFGGGMLNNYGAHTLDQVLQLIGYDVKRLFCSLRIVASVGDAEDVVKVVLETKEGAIGEVDINQASPTNPYFIEVYGTRGTITLPPDDMARFTVRHLPAKGVPARKLDPSLATPGRRYPDGVASFREEVIRVDARRGVDVYADLAQAITTGRPPFVRPEEPLAVLKLIDRCKEEAGTIRRSSLFGPALAPSRRPRSVRAKA